MFNLVCVFSSVDAKFTATIIWNYLNFPIDVRLLLFA